jgi:hypothetical protein
VDSKQFDELVARLAKGPSRREALKGIAGGALAAVGVTAVAEADKKKGRQDSKKKGRGAGAEDKKQGRGKVGPEGCIQTGQKCPSHKPRGKKSKRRGCDACCQGATVVENGQTKCACKPAGTTAASACTAATAYQCCSGICGSPTAAVVANRNHCVAY